MDKRKMKKAVVAGVIIAELAVLDYAAYCVMSGGVRFEVSMEELVAAARVAMFDMEGE